MSETATYDQGLLEAMLAMLQRRGIDAIAVTAYRERSYNIGYCETCSEMVTDVRIYYMRRDGGPGQWDYEYNDLGALIRELTTPTTGGNPNQDKAEVWLDTAVRESDDERWDRYDCHSFDDEPSS